MAAAGKQVATRSKELRCFHFLFEKEKKGVGKAAKTLEQPKEGVTCP